MVGLVDWPLAEPVDGFRAGLFSTLDGEGTLQTVFAGLFERVRTKDCSLVREVFRLGDVVGEPLAGLFDRPLRCFPVCSTSIDI